MIQDLEVRVKGIDRVSGFSFRSEVLKLEGFGFRVMVRECQVEILACRFERSGLFQEGVCNPIRSPCVRVRGS